MPNNVIVLNTLAYLLKTKGNLDESYTFAQQAFALQPQNVAIVDTFAQIYILKKDYSKAVNLYKSIMKKETENTIVTLNYIEALLKNNEVRLAQRELNSREWSTQSDLERVEMIKAKFNL